MNYELAKELKDAGFKHDWRHKTESLAFETYPTIYDLVRACGEGFVFVNKSVEAVAMFWLELKKK